VLQEFVMGTSMLLFLFSLKLLSKRVKKLHWIGAMGEEGLCCAACCVHDRTHALGLVFTACLFYKLNV
jgi:hypothetical protein